MIDATGIDIIYKGCGFVHALCKKPKRAGGISKPREDSINAVIKCYSHPQANNRKRYS